MVTIWIIITKYYYYLFIIIIIIISITLSHSPLFPATLPAARQSASPSFSHEASGDV